MTYQPGEPPSYAQPQDPWSSGSASPPTDPIPAPARGQYAPGVAAPVAPSPGVWSQETVVQGYGDGGRGSGGGRAGLYVLVTILVVVLGGAGGVGAWYIIRERLGGTAPTPTTSQSESTSTGFTPSAVRVGDCMLNIGTTEKPEMISVSCETSGAMKVLKIQSGEGIPHDANGRFNNDTANAICLGVEGWDEGSWFGWNSTNNALDYFFCLDNL